MTVSRDDLSREIRLLPVLRFNKILLERSAGRLRELLRKLVGFEIKGPFASVEAMAGRSLGVQTAVVQTVLVQQRPLPVFPWPDRFFSDSVASAETIKNVGQRYLGQVVFGGSVHDVVPISSRGSLRSVTFLSQPYETSYTLSLLSALINAARHFRFRIRIRFHPRDDPDIHLAMLEGGKDVLEICDRKTLAESISGAYLYVTRV